MDRLECGYSGSPEHEATLCLCGYRDACVPSMYFLHRDSSVNAGWEEWKRRRDGEEVGWMGRDGYGEKEGSHSGGRCAWE